MSGGNAVYRHVKREEWGLAIVVEELEDRTTYLFEDVGTKTLSDDYQHMVVPADLDPAEAESTYARLARKRPRASTARKGSATAKKPDISFEQQLEMFLGQYPGGFEDPAYVEDERGPEDGERLATIRRAGTELSDAALKASTPSALLETIVGLMRSAKKLASPSDAKKVGAIAEDKQPALAAALRDLLHGDGVYSVRFNAWVKALHVEPRPSWPMATLLPALVSPAQQVLVKPTLFRKQATIIEMDGKSKSLPDGSAYSSALEVAKRVGAMLTEAGQHPRDLWDVYAFISKTANARQAKPNPARPVGAKSTEDDNS